MQLLLRFTRALQAAWHAGHRAWDVAATFDSRIRRQQLRLAYQDRAQLERLYQSSPADPHRRGIVRWLP